MKLDKSIVKIISFLTFDGHLMKDLSGFYFCSKQLDTLQIFEEIAKDKWGLRGQVERGKGYGISYKLRFFNKTVAKQLFELGAPKGNKVLSAFSVPVWIKQNKEFSKEYLRTAFDCEGSVWGEKNRICVRFGIFKKAALLAELMTFIDELKDMLNQLGIKTTKGWLMKGNIRKDGQITKGVYFKIKQSSLDDFAKQGGFSDRFKKHRLILGVGQTKFPSTGSR